MFQNWWPRTKTVLLVEDDEGFCYATARAIKEGGYNVATSVSSLDALHKLESKSNLDLLLADVVMAHGQPHGFALARMARIRRPYIPVVYITGYPEYAHDPGEDPLGPIFLKPFRMEDLLAEVRAQLG